MRTVTVQTTTGATWRVRVVWEPRWRALARRFGGWRRKRRDGEGGVDLGLSDIDLPSGGGGGGGGGGLSDLADDIVVLIAIVIGLILFGFLFWWLLLPLLLLVLDVVVVVVLVIVGAVSRVLFRRPWIVQATGEPGGRVSAEVVGWRAALRTRDEMAEKLRLGYRPEDVVRSIVNPAAAR